QGAVEPGHMLLIADDDTDDECSAQVELELSVGSTSGREPVDCVSVHGGWSVVIPPASELSLGGVWCEGWRLGLPGGELPLRGDEGCSEAEPAQPSARLMQDLTRTPFGCFTTAHIQLCFNFDSKNFKIFSGSKETQFGYTVQQHEAGGRQ
ncbi:unnamed protein product, partial [Pleuronectes platessa]